MDSRAEGIVIVAVHFGLMGGLGFFFSLSFGLNRKEDKI